MRRGTTPTYTFEVDFDTSLCCEIWLTFKQGPVEITKTMSERQLTIEDNSITVELSQEETLKFTPNKFVEIQARGLTTEQDAFATNILKVSVEAILKEGVII